MLLAKGEAMGLPSWVEYVVAAVAVAGFGLSIYNSVVARQAPRIQRQAQSRSEMRLVLVPVRSALVKILADLQRDWMTAPFPDEFEEVRQWSDGLSAPPVHDAKVRRVLPLLAQDVPAIVDAHTAAWKRRVEMHSASSSTETAPPSDDAWRAYLESRTRLEHELRKMMGHLDEVLERLDVLERRS